MANYFNEHTLTEPLLLRKSFSEMCFCLPICHNIPSYQIALFQGDINVIKIRRPNNFAPRFERKSFLCIYPDDDRLGYLWRCVRLRAIDDRQRYVE